MFFYYLKVSDDGFLMIFRRFPTTFRRFPKIFQIVSKARRMFPNIFREFPKIYADVRRFPKIAENFRGRLEDNFDDTPANLSTI